MAVKVAVLDDYQGGARQHFDTLDPSAYQVSYFAQTLPPSCKKELIERLEPFDVISTMRERTPLPADVIERLPRLKLVLTSGTRNKAIDVDSCTARGIPVAGAVDYHMDPVDSTTEHVIALILAIARDIAHNDLAVKTGAWQTGYVTALAGKTLGLVGLGRLGAAVARIMHVAFGMRIIAWSTNLMQEAADEKAKGFGLPASAAEGGKTFQVVSREELFSTADVISVHLVLSDRSRGLIAAQDLFRMKPSSFFVNTSRGPLVVERDLLDILKAGRIRGAALDVFHIEPLPPDSEWRSVEWGKNGRSSVLLTPHIAYVEEASISGFYKQQVENLKRWSAGEALSNLLS